MNPVTLADYPQAIAAAESAVLAAQQGARALAEAVEARKAQFGAIVANDKELRNDAQRKAARAELELTDAEYLKLQAQHQAAKDAVVMAQIEADRLLRLWQAEKLATEQAIVRERRMGALEY